MNLPESWVVDASVGVKLFLQDPLSDRAHAFFTKLVADPPAKFYVPDLFYVECANILWKYVRWQGMSAEQVQEYIQYLQKLALTSVPTLDLIEEALPLAVTYKITAYDAVYIVLARRLSAFFITADTKLAQVLPDSVVPVTLLSVLEGSDET